MSKSLTDRVYSECFDPQEVEIFDNIACCKKKILVPCGKCYHCLMTRVNEWVTRMTAQSLISKNTYYVTLTYDSALYGTKFFSETDPTYHAFNTQKKFMPAPLVLNKTHLQKFFKRLRKNTNLKFQYFACGEYGHNYGRPHYHLILWTDGTLSKQEVQFAWSIEENGVRMQIGDIDFQDLNKDCINPEHPYKYVCKYLQKRDFNFKQLKTYKHHVKNFKTNYRGLLWQNTTTMADYQKEFSPFFACSKRPAIGNQYFEENKGRFQGGDFRLFNLPTGSVFPSYFYRKTREAFCPYKTISIKSGKPNSFASIPQVVSMLVDLQNCIEFNEGFCCFNRTYEYIRVENYRWRHTDDGREQGADRLPSGESRQHVVIFQSPKSTKEVRLPVRYFNFYDCKNKYHYSLAGDFMYNVLDSRMNLIYRLPIHEVIKEISLTYDKLLTEFLIPQKAVNETKYKQKMFEIIEEYGSQENYLNAKKNCIKNLLNCISIKQSVYYQQKNLF